MAILAVAAALGTGLLGSRASDDRAVSLEFDVGTEGAPYVGIGPSLVLSPDGARMAVVTGEQQYTELHLRGLDRLDATPLPRTGGAIHPFFSPDGQWIGFFDEGALRKISITGGAPITLCEVEEDSRGGSWGEDGTIVFAPGTTSGLARVPASGGEPEAITTPDPDREGNSHRWPQILPGGDAVLFIGGNAGAFADASIMALSLETGEVHTVHRGGMYARYVPTGHLLYVHEGTLFAAPFDLDRLELTGSPAPVLEDVIAAPSNAGAQYSVAGDGTLVYVGGVQAVFQNSLHWADGDGEVSPPIVEDGIYLSPALSPDGGHVAVAVGIPPEADLWIRDLTRSTMTRLTFDSAGNVFPVWSPDGRWVAYGAPDPDGITRIWAQRADGSGERVQLSGGEIDLIPFDWSSDGKVLTAVGLPGIDLHLLRLPDGFLEGATVEPVEPEPYLATEFNETMPMFSPDGRWIAYESNETGENEIYVRPVPGPGGKWQISTDGGHFPVWSADGTELFYLDDDAIMAVPYTTTAETFSVGQPRSVVELPMSPTGSVPSSFWARIDVAPDADRFLVLQSDATADQQQGARPTIVLNWFEELRRRMTAGR